ncbi:hypothetical protein DBV15_09195 [Temnothorax longispinosus]|uniref:Uncharacterized protein n=1 Tax=Temnothorax longispinosus TaxID=300112 RepID=A0A4S2KNM7_9HYME|nr:hypothetical protein DBV15_09195 [Temnothorax longispinosus]
MARHTDFCFGNIHDNFEKPPRTHVTLLNLIESDASTHPPVRSHGMPARPPNPSCFVGKKIVPIHFRIFILGNNEPEIYHQRERHRASARTPFFIPDPYNYELISPRRRIIYELDVARAANRRGTTFPRERRRIAFAKGAVISPADGKNTKGEERRPVFLQPPWGGTVCGDTRTFRFNFAGRQPLTRRPPTFRETLMYDTLTTVGIERIRLVSNVLENIRMRITVYIGAPMPGDADASISLGMPGTRGRDATILSRSSIIERKGYSS